VGERAAVAEAWQVLDRRIGQVMQFEKFKARVKAGKERLPDPFDLLARLRYGAR